MKRQSSRGRWIAIGALSPVAGSTMACSVCIAHSLGSAIHGIGAQTLHRGDTVIGISFTTFNKSQDGESSGSTESHRQAEYTVHLLHGMSNQWTLTTDIPYTFKRLSMTGETPIDTRGLGDITIGAKYQVKPKEQDRFLYAFTFDLKLPTGANNLKDAMGDPLEAHSQIGTGSTDLAIGLVATTELKRGDLLYGGLSTRINGSNQAGYRYGNVVFYNLGYSHPLSSSSSMVIEFNGRLAQRDLMDTGERDENSGGHLGYLSASYRQSFSGDYGFVGTFQVPVIRSLNGSQRESGLLTVGVFKRL